MKNQRRSSSNRHRFCKSISACNINSAKERTTDVFGMQCSPTEKANAHFHMLECAFLRRFGHSKACGRHGRCAGFFWLGSFLIQFEIRSSTNLTAKCSTINQFKLEQHALEMTSWSTTIITELFIIYSI